MRNKLKSVPRSQRLLEFQKQQEKLFYKHKEYQEKTLDELKKMLPMLGGGYKKICNYVINLKESELNLEGDVK